jgi:hypothetical protein
MFSPEQDWQKIFKKCLHALGERIVKHPLKRANEGLGLDVYVSLGFISEEKWVKSWQVSGFEKSIKQDNSFMP